MSSDATARLSRLLAVFPLFADREEIEREELEQRSGVDVEELLEDLSSLAEDPEGAPPGFVSSVEALIEHGRVAVRTSHFLRPLRLTIPELCALELGLAMLAASSAADEQHVIARARGRVRQAIAKMPAGERAKDLWFSQPPMGSDSPVLTSLRDALRARRKARLAYRRGGGEEAQERVVHPYALIPANGTWYCAAHCETSGGLRFFRLDRMEDAAVLPERYELPSHDAVQKLMASKPFHAEQAEVLTLRYSPRVARWIAEREQVPLAPDGSLTLAHPLADLDWAVRHVLQYGPDAEVLGPERVRREIVRRLQDSLS